MLTCGFADQTTLLHQIQMKQNISRKIRFEFAVAHIVISPFPRTDLKEPLFGLFSFEQDLSNKT